LRRLAEKLWLLACAVSQEDYAPGPEDYLSSTTYKAIETMPSLLDRIQEALAPDYMVEGTIASGGMGTVFLGRDQRLDRRVAIKTLRQEIATAVAVQRFVQEAQHLARLNHPNIVRVHDAGEADDLVYYVMDYVEGKTLDARIQRSPLSVSETQKLGRELLRRWRSPTEAGRWPRFSALLIGGP
jgi:serine/threonine protein kinase